MLPSTSVAGVASTPLDPLFAPSMTDPPRANGPPRHAGSVPLEGAQNPENRKVLLYKERDESATCTKRTPAVSAGERGEGGRRSGCDTPTPEGWWGKHTAHILCVTEIGRP